ncbi:PAAR domain-containing protein [Paraburkholderia sp. J63]|uniref:PAAR domain-containing protein n=1 Tax=Paraburkholderia sp. J63 TaxID=2805434 RepID=UPI002ABD65CC|nr:PAAR domain-containing protein [Paraburkholderia sp. J63]
MMRRIAVVGDKLEHGGEILPYDGPEFTWEGHQSARVGGAAFCEQCKSTGIIAKTGGPYRLTFDMGEVAMDDDIVLCGCANPPRIKAKLSGESWCTDQAEHHHAIAQASALLAADASKASRHDEQFTLRDANGRSLAATYYTIRFPSGSVAHGVTDALGRTMRYKTNGEQRIMLYLGHREA